MIVADFQSGHSCHQRNKPILGGCLCNQEGQAAVHYTVSKIVSSVEWKAVQTEKNVLCCAVKLFMPALHQIIDVALVAITGR